VVICRARFNEPSGIPAWRPAILSRSLPLEDAASSARKRDDLMVQRAMQQAEEGATIGDG